MRDPVTPRIPAGALLTNPALRERDNGLSSCEARGGDRGWQCIIHLQQLEHAMGPSSGKTDDIEAYTSSRRILEFQKYPVNTSHQKHESRGT